MNKIIINRGSFKLDEVEFEQGTITIGRSTDNTISLDDSAVSSHHAKIVTLFHTSYIEDLDSTNGTLLNGKGVQKRTLHSGDVLSLGNHQLLFQSDEAEKKVSQTSETVMLRGSEIKKKLNEFMQAQAEMEQEKHNTADESASSASENKPTADTKQNLNAVTNIENNDNSATKASLEKNQAWIEARNKQTKAVSASGNAVNKSASVVPINDKIKHKPSDSVSDTSEKNTAATESKPILIEKHQQGQAKKQQPVQNTAAALKAAAASIGVGSNTSIAKSAQNTNAAAHVAAAQNRRSNDSAYHVGNGVMALDKPRSRSKILPAIWILIVAVLIGELVYITYRSLG